MLAVGASKMASSIMGPIMHHYPRHIRAMLNSSGKAADAPEVSKSQHSLPTTVHTPTNA